MSSPFKYRGHHRPRLHHHDKMFPNYATVLARIANVRYGNLETVDYLVACPARQKDARLLGLRIDRILVRCIEPSLIEEYNTLREGDHIRVKVFHCARAASQELGAYVRGDYIGKRLENLVEEPDATSGN